MVPAASGPAERVVALDEPAAQDASLVGAKAANLAAAAAAGLAILDGFVVTTAAIGDGVLDADVATDVRRRWASLSDAGRQPVVVRSSSTVEDIGTSSMAGQFRSVLGVDSWDACRVAIGEVLASADRTGADRQPMAVLVQRQLRVAAGGVLFGIDPVSGDPQRMVVEAVAGGPDRLVSGQVTATRYVLRPSGRPVASHPSAASSTGASTLLSRQDLRRLARLAGQAARAFGGPQDIEWAIDADGRLWLLQSRPVTATGHTAEASGPVLGPGPVAETFPAALRPLEADLWVEPLAEGVANALRAALVVPHARLDASPVVTTVGGWVAADLVLFGYHPPAERRWRAFTPRRLLRRLGSAWRVGRLRAALPDGARALVARADAWLASVPPVTALDDVDLVALLDRSHRVLVALHGHEALASTLLGRAATTPTVTGARLALDALRVGRAAGLDDDRLRYRHPEVLALVPPRLGPAAPLPEPPAPTAAAPAPARLDDLGPREALRLRARWVQELSARAATELAGRLAARGRVPASGVANLRLPELLAVAGGGCPPADLDGRTGCEPGPPLPAAFRLGPDGQPVAAARWGARPQGGVGAGGGRGAGPVVQAGPEPPGRSTIGAVLVVRTLDPTLAPRLPGLAGLVAETGSTLSHLAILAREHGVPTVVAVPDALHRFPPGTQLLVDGDTGEVRMLEGGAA